MRKRKEITIGLMTPSYKAERGQCIHLVCVDFSCRITTPSDLSTSPPSQRVEALLRRGPSLGAEVPPDVSQLLQRLHSGRLRGLEGRGGKGAEAGDLGEERHVGLRGGEGDLLLDDPAELR